MQPPLIMQMRKESDAVLRVRAIGQLKDMIGCGYNAVTMQCIIVDTVLGVTNVKRMKSILLSKEKLCLYIHESLEHHGSPWKLTIANASGGE